MQAAVPAELGAVGAVLRVEGAEAPLHAVEERAELVELEGSELVQPGKET